MLNGLGVLLCYKKNSVANRGASMVKGFRLEFQVEPQYIILIMNLQRYLTLIIEVSLNYNAKFAYRGLRNHRQNRNYGQQSYDRKIIA